MSCMDAVAALIAASTAAEHEFMFNLLTECVRRLEVTFTKPVTTADERTDLESSQVFMCALIQFLLPELGESTLALVPNIMALATRVIDAAAAIATEEAYRVVGTVAQLLEGRMADYLPGFYPRLRSGLVMRDVPNVCAAALWCASEVIRYSASAISAYINDIITILLDTLRAPEITRKVGPECLSVFGDIATALGVGISEYFAGIMTVMATAAATPDPVRGALARVAAFFECAALITPAATETGSRSCVRTCKL
ncbi:hypothetical protein EON67_00495 [archaeon]|nr:MAG: hypothetical protein EON67_00495 [archaeon]